MKFRSGLRVITSRLLLAAGMAGWLAAAGPLWAQGHSIEVFALKYRTGEQMVALVRPLVPPPGSVSAISNHLVVRTTPENMVEIRSLLARVDTVPRPLLITVSQDVDRHRDASRVSATGRVGALAIGSQGELSVGTGRDRPGNSGVQADIVRSRGTEAQRDIRRIQVLEGVPAMIYTGESTPVASRQWQGGAQGSRRGESVDYRERSTGFQVLARVDGDQVLLEISPQRQVAGDAGAGSVDSQILATTVSGRVGEWIDLGGVTRTDDEGGAVVLGRTRQAAAELRSVRVRVELLR